MSDNITLPREVVKSAIAALESSLVREPGGTTRRERESITALRAALAAEQPKPEPVAWMDRFGFVFRGKGPHETFTTPLYTAPSALAASPPSEDIEALRREDV